MAPTRSLLRKIQRDSYRISRASGDLHAAERGPEVYARRRARRYLTRTVFRLFRG
ncbi:MAG TPA: hypothetical protein VNE21_09520 [Mycobacteriales bacterium]|nr:hypothetical protein [Mycobacteriales bacterium]